MGIMSAIDVMRKHGDQKWSLGSKDMWSVF